MSTAIRLTAAQALVRWMAAQQVDVAGVRLPFFAGVWAIFGHGNVAALGEALAASRDVLPTYRAHSEQGMAHAAIGFAKAHRRRRAMACTSSIGPGATNMVTAAALAHVNRLPVLFLPGDVYASRRPDPVLQQVEQFGDPCISANDCFRPVSRLFDRIARPEQLLDALPRAMAVLTDPAACGPVTLSLCQDVQAEAFDCPARFLEPRLWTIRRPAPDAEEMTRLIEAVRAARAPLIVAGGGVRYAGAEAALETLVTETGIPVAETQAGKGALPHDHPAALGGIGVTGTDAANRAAATADVVIALGTRLQDFTTGSRTMFAPDVRLFQVNVALHDVAKHGAEPVLGDAQRVVQALLDALGGWRACEAWRTDTRCAMVAWRDIAQRETGAEPRPGTLPSDAEVIGAVRHGTGADCVLVCAAGGLPGDLHRYWHVERGGDYHAEYGFSCMGYEIAGALGVKLADPTREVVVMVGDGSYLMLNAELATSVAMRLPLTVVLVDNRGFGCIHRLQQATGGEPFNNLLADDAPVIDFVAHARSLGAHAEQVELAALADAVARARDADRSTVLVVRTDPTRASAAGGHWWDVAVPEISRRGEVAAARRAYDAALAGLSR